MPGDICDLEGKCPAFAHQVKKSLRDGRNLQSAVFSECVYAQTLANVFELPVFTIHADNPSFLPSRIAELLATYGLVPRYVYSKRDGAQHLIQAGSCNGVDSAFVIVKDLAFYSIEFKEPYAKSPEPDLPKPCEDGLMRITDDFLARYPQFEMMLREQASLNFWELVGHNERRFSADAIRAAIANSYVKKYADVLCTEDRNGYLVMLPANQVQQWAQLEGEIRSAGRNHYAVWTPRRLKAILHSLGARIADGVVIVPASSLTPRRERGGGGKSSGWKLHQFFFVRGADRIISGDVVKFPLSAVRQLCPTIAGKMNFRGLDAAAVRDHYLPAWQGKHRTGLFAK